MKFALVCIIFISLASQAATFTVTTVADSGAGSLRQALSDAETLNGADIISFSQALSGQRISLSTFANADGNGNTALSINDSGGITIDATSLPNGIGIVRNTTVGTFRLISVNSGANVTMNGLTLSGGGGSSFASGGGAIYNSGSLTLNRCTLRANSANSMGGGIYNVGSLMLSNCTLSGNSAIGSGGGIQNAGALAITHCTLTGNVVSNLGSNGGGVYNAVGQSMTLTHSIISSNTAGSGQNIYNLGTLTRNGVNFVPSAITGGGVVNGAGMINTADPKLEPLMPISSSEIKTHALLPGSPAINAAIGSTATFDQRGYPIAGVPDVGAYEALISGPFPTQDSHTFNTQPQLSWSGPTGASYAVYFGTGGAPLPLIGTPGESASFNVPEQATGPKFWRVDATVNGIIYAGQVFSFTIASRIVSSEASLHSAVQAAAANPGPDTLTFAADLNGGTMIMSTFGTSAAAAILIDQGSDLTLDATGLPSGLTIDGILFRRIIMVYSGSLTLRGITLANGGGNSVNFGGAIYNHTGCSLTLERCTLSGNQVDAGSGGGGAIFNLGSAILRHCTLSGNQAKGSPSQGAAINNNGSMELIHCTLSGNQSNGIPGRGGAIANFSGGNLNLSYTIVSGNTASAQGPDIYNLGTINRVGVNIIGNLTDSGQTAGGTLLTGEAMLAPLASNGGPGKTYALLPGSPARDSGIASNATSDQRGYPIVGVSDIGAFEVQSSSVNLASSALPSVFGQNVLFTASVFPTAPDTVIPTGGVIFTVDGISGSPVALNGSGIAVLSTSVLSVGSHLISASYSGDSRLLPSSSSEVNQTVNKVETMLNLGSNFNPSTVGVHTSFTATISPVTPGTGIPDGLVVFSIDGTQQLPPVLLVGGKASLATNALSAGGHAITADYSGGINYSGSSNTLNLMVNGPVTLSGAFPQGLVGKPYIQSLTAAGGTGVKAMIITNFDSGDTGLDAPFVSTNTATLDGTPTGAGTLTFDLTAMDEVGATTTLSYSLTVLELLVSNLNPDGQGSLAASLHIAAQSQGTDTISFAPSLNGQTLTLNSELLVDDSTGGVIIDATGLSNGVTIRTLGEVNYRLLQVQSGSTLIVRGVTFANGGGGSFNGSGGAILNKGTLSLSRCTVRNSRAENGGGIYSDTGSTLTLDRCTVSGCNAVNGGGLMLNGSATLTQCTLAGNSAHTAASLLAGIGSSVTLLQCTVADGYASLSCSGVLARGTLSLQHCVLGQNSGVEVPAVALLVESGTTELKGANIIEKTIGATVGPVAVSASPLLQALGNYGGPTQTMPPQLGSPALDQASVLNPALTTDQRGLPRPVGLRPDLGAVEGNIIVVTTPVDELDTPGIPGHGISLREAVRDIPAGGTIAFDRGIFTGATAMTNTITLTKGPLNPQRNCTLNGSANPGGMKILTQFTITQQPQSLALSSGAVVSFLVVVANVSGGVAYQWRQNSLAIDGFTGAGFGFSDAQEYHEGVYDVMLSESASPGTLNLANVIKPAASAISQPASLIVDGSPVMVKRSPSSSMLALGSSHTLSVVAAGPGTLTYQWSLNGKNISGATKSSHLITKAALANAGTYRCVVKSGANSVTSESAEIGVVDATPKTVNLLASPTASFTATVNAAGNGITYAWLKNDSDTIFATKSFNIKPATAEHAGLYTCTVTGAAGVFSGGAPTRLNVSNAASQIIKPLTLPPAFIGQAYFYQIPIANVVGAPATAFTVGGLPPGMTWDKLTGIISGRPTASTKPLGYPLTINASNPSSSDTATATLNVNVVPANAVGIYAGPLERSPLNYNLGGRFDLTTTATGLCSGSITLGARAKISFTNQLLLSAGTGDVILRVNIPGLTMADKTPLTAYLEVFSTQQLARLTLIHPDGTTLLATAWRKTWSKTRPATDYAATYTARLDPANVGNAPRGYGFATLTVAVDGSVKLTGKLPDGSGLTDAGFVGPEGQLTLFNLLHAKRGSLVGPMQITLGTPVVNNTLGATLSWFKPGPLPKSTDTVYQAGFDPLNVAVEGSPYAAPAKGQRVLGLGTAPNPNTKLDFTLGGLAPEFAQLLYISNPSATGLTNKGTLTLPLTNATKLTTLDAAKGFFTGSFVISGVTTALNRPAPFEGMVVKICATTQGYGYFLLPSVPVGTEKVTTSPKLSGRVALGVP